ncbi:unnamed protein product [marine sediment metagenome]|uniref:Bacteriophage T5 Orf172 DNA-binding domain-containing protein n=1 Tax=marine sediment metagenome TaxID=412755 RepID=X1UW05_9ZZZZ
MRNKKRLYPFKSIYFILDEEANAVKIGIALFPETRLKHLQATNPHKLTLVKIIENGGFELEQELHRKFADAKLHNEWFHLTDELRDYIYLDGRQGVFKLR